MPRFGTSGAGLRTATTPKRARFYGKFCSHHPTTAKHGADTRQSIDFRGA